MLYFEVRILASAWTDSFAMRFERFDEPAPPATLYTLVLFFPSPTNQSDKSPLAQLYDDAPVLDFSSGVVNNEHQ
jgi:hypothetical protein